MRFMHDMRLRDKILKRGGLYPGDFPATIKSELDGHSMHYTLYLICILISWLYAILIQGFE